MSMHNSPLVSVIIRSYNQEHFVAEAIASALRQDYAHLEVVVADDCSRDATAEVVNNFDDPRVHYHRNEKNLGRVGNKRRALGELASGDWALFLDADDCLIHDSFLAEAMDLATRHKDLVMVAGGYARQERGGSRVVRLPALAGVRDGKEVFYDWNNSAFIHAATVYHRRRALDIDFYRLTVVGSDTESLLRLCLHGHVALLHKAVAMWRLHEGNCTQTLDFATHVKDGLRVFESAAEYALETGQEPARVASWLQGYSVKYLDDYLGKLLLETLQPQDNDKNAQRNLRELRGYVNTKFKSLPPRSRPALHLRLFAILGPRLYTGLFQAKKRLRDLLLGG